MIAHRSTVLFFAVDTGKILPSGALQLLLRISKLVSDQEITKRVQRELDGFELFGASPEDTRKQLKRIATEKKSFGKVDLGKINIDKAVDALYKDFPDYRVLAFKQEYVSSFKECYMTDSITKYEELLERIRRDSKTRYTYSVEDDTVVLSAAELNKLVGGARRWVYQQAADLAERLEFGEIPASALETTFEFVDTQLFELVPDAAERLIVAYQNLAERSEENWVNVVDTCRRIIKSFADAVFPAQPQSVNGLDVTEEKYLNRLRAFAKQSIDSRRQREQVGSVIELLAELLARTDNLASRSVHTGQVSRFEAERILLYTYLAIGDLMLLTGLGERSDTTKSRPNLNELNFEDLQSKLGLTRAVAAEIVKARKYHRFEIWEDVKQVQGIGPKTLSRLMDVASL